MNPSTLILIMVLPTGAEVPQAAMGFPSEKACHATGKVMTAGTQLRYECRRQFPSDVPVPPVG